MEPSVSVVHLQAAQADSVVGAICARLIGGQPLNAEWEQFTGLALWRLCELFGTVDGPVAYLNGFFAGISQDPLVANQVQSFHALALAYFKPKLNYPLSFSIGKAFLAAQLAVESKEPITETAAALQRITRAARGEEVVEALARASACYYRAKALGAGCKAEYDQLMLNALAHCSDAIETPQTVAARIFFQVHCEWPQMPAETARMLAESTWGPSWLPSAHLQLMSEGDLNALQAAGGIPNASDLTKAVFSARLAYYANGPQEVVLPS